MCCGQSIPKRFCDEHNLADHVTMMDSTGHTLWHMHCQSRLRARTREYLIGNGWREFAYDHGLKRNDKLLFTLVSPSHFVVDYATAKGCAREMRPTRDGKRYPWVRHSGRGGCWKNFSENIPTGLPTASKQPLEEKSVLQCKSVKVKDRESHSRCSTEMMYSFPELTHMECRNPDGMLYCEVTDEDEEDASE